MFSLQVQSWPYDCTYPSIVKHHGTYLFRYDIYTCCKACNYPDYTKCVKDHGSPDWRCPSDGVHCVVECVKKYGPGTETVIIKTVGGKGMGIGLNSLSTHGGKEKKVKVNKKLQCTKVEKLPNGKTCIRRLCIALNA
jgi:hypothetical protein